nr:uncharacterized protein LOC115256720 [Aedes albopictus]
MSRNSQIQTRQRYTKTAVGVKQNARKNHNANQPQVGAKEGTIDPPEHWTGEVLYLEPIDFEQPTQQHPVDVGKCLRLHNVTGFRDIQMIGKFRFKVTFGTTEEARKLTGLTMREHNLKCYVPQTFRESIGLVKDVPCKYGEKELLEEIEADVAITKVERVHRMDQAKKLVPTKNVKVTFKGKEIPGYVVLYGCKMKVDLFLFPVKQCRNCWGYGHKTNNCKRSKKCGACGKPSSEHDEQCIEFRCINCQGNHAADAQECPERRKQRKISEKMQQNKLTYKEAKSSFLQNQFQLLQDYEEEFPEIDTRSEAGTTVTEGRRAWRPKQSQRVSNKGEAKQNRDTEQRKHSGNRTSTRTLDENPYKSTEFERMLMEMKAFWKNVGLVGKLKQLQEAIKEEMCNKQTDISYEELIIRISTVIGEIAGEVVSNMATSEERLNKKSEEDSSQNNGV